MEFIEEFMAEFISSVSSTARQDTAREMWVASFQVLPWGKRTLAPFALGTTPGVKVRAWSPAQSLQQHCTLAPSQRLHK